MLGAGEDQGEVAAVLAGGVIDIAQAELGDFGVEDIIAVHLAVHPPVVGVLGVAAKIRIAHHDILQGGGVAVALGGNARVPGGAIRADVVDEIVAGHVGGMDGRGGIQWGGGGNRIEFVISTRLIDQAQKHLQVAGVRFGLAIGRRAGDGAVSGIGIGRRRGSR